jgi:lariat debranching enzyme
MRSIYYHIRDYNVRRLTLVSICQCSLIVANHIQLSSPDVFLSHDWPCGVEQYGDLNDFLRRKPFLRGDIQSKQLGSLLRNLKPSWWLLHTYTRASKFACSTIPLVLLQSQPVIPMKL